MTTKDLIPTLCPASVYRMHLKVGNMWLWLNEPVDTNFDELHALDETMFYVFINNYLNQQPLNLNTPMYKVSDMSPNYVDY